MEDREELMLERAGYLLVAAEPKSLVSVGTHEEQREFCLVWFGSDGSIYVEPRLHAGPGIVSTAAYTPEGEKLINLMERGKAASQTVKLSHHPDGRVHFSKPGHVAPRVGRMSFPLSSGAGKVFDVKVFNPGKLDLLRKEKRDRAHVRLQFSVTLPSAVVVSGHWVSISDAMALAQCESVPCGPLVQVRVGSGGTVPCFLLRQPPEYPYRDHLLMLEVHPGEPGPDEEISALLVGAHDVGQGNSGEIGLIASLYPFRPQLEPGESLESLDQPSSGSPLQPSPKRHEPGAP
jgi:hypothetical protein